MALNLHELRVVFEFRDLSKPGVESAKQNIRSLQGEVDRTATRGRTAFQNIAGGFTSLFVARAAGQGIFAAIQPAIELQTAMGQLAAISGFTAGQLENVKQAAFDAALATKFSPEEAVQGLGDLFRAGITTEGGLNRAIFPVLALAQAGERMGLTVSEAARSVSVGMANFGREVGGASAFVDRLIRSIQLSRVNLQAMPELIGKLGMAAAASGSSFDQLMTVFIAASRTFPQTARLGTELLRFTGELSDPVRIQRMQELFGIPATQGGRLRPVTDIMADLFEVIDRGGVVAQGRLHKIFDEAAIKAILAAAKQLREGIELPGVGRVAGRGVFAAIQRELELSGGATKRFAEEALKPLSEQFGLLKEQLDRLLSTLGGPFVNALGGLVRMFVWLGTAINKLAHIPGLGLALKGLFSLTLMVGTVVTAMLAWKGAGMILNAVLGQQVFKLRVAQALMVGAGTGYWGMARAAGAAAVANWTLAGALNAVKVGLLRIIGLTGIGLVVGFILDKVVGSLMDMAGLGAGASDKQAAQARSAAADVARAAREAAEGLGHGAGSLEGAAKKLDSVISPRAPRIRERDFDAAQRSIDFLARTQPHFAREFQVGTQAALNRTRELTRDVLARRQRGEIIPQEIINEMREKMAQVANSLDTFAVDENGPVRKSAQAFEDMWQGLGRLASPLNRFQLGLAEAVGFQPGRRVFTAPGGAPQTLLPGLTPDEMDRILPFITPRRTEPQGLMPEGIRAVRPFLQPGVRLEGPSHAPRSAPGAAPPPGWEWVGEFRAARLAMERAATTVGRNRMFTVTNASQQRLFDMFEQAQERRAQLSPSGG